MTILCTGNAGFIGSHLANHLLKEGHKIVGVDNLSGGFKRNIDENIEFINADLSDTHAVAGIFKTFKPQVVFHIAADATEGRSQFTPISAARNNFWASANVFTHAIKNGVKRIVFTSSMSVYGGQEAPFSEDMPRKPVDVYGVNKASSEHVLEILAKVHGIEHVIIRPHNVFGERQNIRDAYRNVVGIFINRMLNGQAPIIYGDGEQRRAFTHVDNLVPYLAKCATSDKVVGEIINIGPTDHYSINELARQIAKEVSFTGEFTYVPDRPLEVKEAHCTMDKAQRLLGYKTTVSFEEGIKRMVAWAKGLGYQEPVYRELELVNSKTPITWKDKLI